ncbi:Fe3+ hydroxamate ABC transporter substrate-binding protein [Kurthia zopfii]|uniref:Fe3+ hydroxamate ABC transporter substrate-binding protein n=1 Tax=Kurthia zopfii TaxID=1650 RepID=UPI000D678119|nr:Fe3+ hydroxamate ABC transporter substrate-binding protein [Kurthia zopfii]PWI23695.1 Fe3+ hydroxamate ABC transporter substrate-binding protein [Kurthia zopfii]
MLLITPTCISCKKTIQNDEEVYVKLRYPKRKGITEIKAFLNLEGTFICEECSKEKFEK